LFSRVAVDIGGTFTDLVGLDPETGRILLGKSPTTPAELAEGVLDTFRIAKIDPKNVKDFVGHGSTVIINALTERKGARTGFLTTKGYRDMLIIQRCNRTDMYNFAYEKPKPFVPRHLSAEVTERLDFKGEELSPLSKEDVRKAIDLFEREEVESVAICFIHSYANPEHEAVCAKFIKDALPKVYVTSSHELTREWREYERANTAVMNAYVRPIAERYLESLEKRLKKLGVTATMYAMLSNGGTARFERAKTAPVYMVESGPVGGVIAAKALGEALKEKNIITLDIGGTTAKSTLIEDGQIRVNTDYQLGRTRFFSGYPIKVPVVDIVEIGAGGGSIAWIDAGGALRVGPQSAGAEPGPACYDKGGTKPTTVDANLLAGRLNPDYFLGGQMKLNVDKAQNAVSGIAKTFNVTEREAALGILRIANSNMINMLNLISIQRGYDPRDFALMAFGGGGGLHAPMLARELQVGTVIVPENPAHFSAWGMLLTDLRRDYMQTKVLDGDENAINQLNEMLGSVEELALQQFREEGVAENLAWFERSLDVRYKGQEHTVRTPLRKGKGPIDAKDLKQTIALFHQLHYKAYAFRLDGQTEIVNVHVAAFGKVRKPAIKPVARRAGSLGKALKAYRKVDYDEEGVKKSKIYERDLIPTGAKIKGPAVVEEPACTTLVYPGQTLTVDKFGNLVVRTGA